VASCNEGGCVRSRRAERWRRVRHRRQWQQRRRPARAHMSRAEGGGGGGATSFRTEMRRNLRFTIPVKKTPGGAGTHTVPVRYPYVLYCTGYRFYYQFNTTRARSGPLSTAGAADTMDGYRELISTRNGGRGCVFVRRAPAPGRSRTCLFFQRIPKRIFCLCVYLLWEGARVHLHPVHSRT